MKTKAVRIQFKVIVLIALGFVFATNLSGCLSEGSGSEGETDVVAEPTPEPPTPPLTTPDRTVCDPFNAGASAQDRGWIGNLLYLTDDQPRYTSVNDYMDHATPIPSTLYFDKIFVPTRAFDLGFYTQDGTLVLNQNDEAIYEYFALRLETQLSLAAGETPGYYQMALLSDDGAVLEEENSDGTVTTIVNNDGVHSTRLGCAPKAIYMDATTRRNVVLKYFQGPRFHIAMTVMWRKLADTEDPNAPLADAECGRSGNGRFFNSTVVPSAPTAVYYEMLTRGWKPLENDNYTFPEQANNPCAQEEPLLISNFAITATARTSVTVSWVTSRPASTKAEVKNVASGVIITSPEDTAQKTSHSVTITGLTANTLYSVKGLSQAADGQLAISSESAFRTPR